MHFVIMGCGRVGASLAREFERRGYSVAIIDLDESAFRRLGPNFSGLTVKGVGYDRNVLESARIQDAAGFAAVSSGDNSNILAARTVQGIYHVKNTVSRVYDQGRADVYERLGIPTVATVKWARSQVLRSLLPEQAGPEWRDSSDTIRLTRIKVNPNWAGYRIFEMSEIVKTQLPFLIRLGEGIVPDKTTVFQEGDMLLAACITGRAPEVEAYFAQPPKGRE